MNRLPQTRIVIMLMSAVLLVGGGVTMWSRNTSQAIKARYQQLTAEVPDENELKKMVGESQLIVDDHKTQLQHLEQGVPNLAYVPTLLTELENLGKEHHISVTGVRPIVEQKVQRSVDDKVAGTSVKKQPYQEMSIDITGRGSYENVMQMVEAIKKFPKIIAIQTVGLQPRRQNSGETQEPESAGLILDATVRIKAYLFPLPATGTTGQPAVGGSS